MRLDELKWYTPPGGGRRAYFRRHDKYIVDVWENWKSDKFDGTYNLYLEKPKKGPPAESSCTSLKEWRQLEPIVVQCVIYHLLAEGNDAAG